MESCRWSSDAQLSLKIFQNVAFVREKSVRLSGVLAATGMNGVALVVP